MERSRVALATTYHDPQGGLQGQIGRVLPLLTRLFAGLAIQTTQATPECVLAPFREAGAIVAQDGARATCESPKVGRARCNALRMALDQNQDTSVVMYCDCDRLLHWADTYPDELAQVLGEAGTFDFLVLGRTPRAYATHPRIQRDTEAIINHVFGVVSGRTWDVTGATRILSRRAAVAVLEGCPDEEISTDVSWPLFLQRAGGFSLGYRETEGLEFETADRFAEEIARVGLANWLARLDSDPRLWAERLETARIEVAAMTQT